MAVKPSCTPTSTATGQVGRSIARWGMFGVHLAKVAAEFKLDVEDRLATILPASAEVDSGDDDRRPSRRK